MLPPKIMFVAVIRTNNNIVCYKNLQSALAIQSMSENKIDIQLYE